VPTLPAEDGRWIRNPIDAFVLAALRGRRLSPSGEADRSTLLRRLSFDLLGLPPTPEETEAFTADADPQAYERLVDRLLASPRLGERWARHWLDTIHFAETHGFEHDLLRANAWRYRDYVIRSFNRDTPWPRFIREQLAADVFFPNQPQLTAALGFLGAGPYDQSTATTAPVTFDYLDRDDMVTQTMAAFASTTANCARCHDHKFDPITQEDYYALQAVFAGLGRGEVAYDENASIAARRNHWQALRQAAETQNGAVLLAAEYEPIVADWLQSRAPDPGDLWTRLELESFQSSGGTTFARREDGAVRASGPRPDKDAYTIVTATKLSEVSAIRLDVLTDASLPKNGPGRQDNGNLHLTEFELQLVAPGASQGPPLKIRHATADFDQAGWTIAHALDGNLNTAWGIYPRVGQPHYAVFELDNKLALPPGATLTVILKQLHGSGHLIGCFRLAATSAPAAKAVVLPAAVTEALKKPAGQRSPADRLAIAAHVLTNRAEEELARLPPEVKVYAAGRTFDPGGGRQTLAVPKTVRVLRRGDIRQPGAVAVPGAISAISGLPGRFALPDSAPEAARRAALADWLADSNNPLTWRSIANRIWHYHFGRGLCDTPSDLGRMGGRPSHPELLDWLACELRDSGGSLKHLHRLIVTSATYRQVSTHRPEVAAVDADNRLLGRMCRQRLDAESYRDAVLAVSGRFDLAMGGPSVQHFRTSPGPQLTPNVDYEAVDWDAPGMTRRSIYRLVWRGIPDPLLEALDFPDAALLAPQRTFSASPLQALVLWNNAFVLHHSQHLARRLESLGSSTDERVRAAFRLVLLRAPSDAERAAFVACAEKHGLAVLCRVLLNSNEFLFVN